MFHVKHTLRNEAAEGSEEGSGWQESLPESVQSWNEVKEAKSPEAFWDQMGNMRSFMGQSIRVPTDDASKEDKAAFNQRLLDKVPNLMQKPDLDNQEVMDSFYNQMGRPDEAGKYNAPDMQAPEGITLQEGLPEAFKGIAHKHGLSQKQYEGIVKDYTANSVEEVEVQMAQHKKDMSSLNDEWGVKYDPNLERAEAIRAKYFSKVVPDLRGADADTIRAFSSIADKFGAEGSQALIESTRNEHSNLVAPVEAQARLDEILGNRDHAYWDGADPAHGRAVEKVNQLTKMANPKLSSSTDSMRSNVSVEIG